MLEVDAVSQVYADGTRALDGVSLSIRRGLFGLLGPNGAGKSSLMRVAATLQVPTAGRVSFDGIDRSGGLPHRSDHRDRWRAGCDRAYCRPRGAAVAGLGRLSPFAGRDGVPARTQGPGVIRRALLRTGRDQCRRRLRDTVMDVAAMRRLRFAIAPTIIVAGSQIAHAAPPATPPSAPCREHAPEAAVRSRLAVDVILRVMRAESGGSARDVSTKGAIGCMQIMPSTWAYRSQRYGLGVDPYDARLNMIGGALYLAELAHRFGLPGAHAAYNAGPARYIRYAANGVPLPAETVAYAARLGGAAAPAIAAGPRARWQEGRLFLDRKRDAGETSGVEALRPSAAPDGVDASPVSPSASLDARIGPTLFPLAANATLTQR